MNTSYTYISCVSLWDVDTNTLIIQTGYYIHRHTQTTNYIHPVIRDLRMLVMRINTNSTLYTTWYGTTHYISLYDLSTWSICTHFLFEWTRANYPIWRWKMNTVYAVLCVASHICSMCTHYQLCTHCVCLRGPVLLPVWKPIFHNAYRYHLLCYILACYILKYTIV